jgi:heme O synthase-like polyprenyltransferase
MAGITGVNIPKIDPSILLTNGLNIAYFVAGVIAVISIIVGGFMYTVSHGDPGEITKARNTILYSVVGLVVILVAFSITNFIIGRF